ncbi:MerR family transcriptional regulator [Actinosynnema sp. NPDC047251]|uniref:Putative HTH-type transcriptional regulator n=1 Tax=Saccharothrix espanaensis (strain ATCC 51144 / DSM 44229 / JCM 9112 / NBRC 15066 / NRRL 15764) TaxID=1179773 RepID=K0K0F2_SACES|nr:MerR family transcriptional regulator [Saccharothrix espanaensis]CCH33720.1 putative HTH-type transcriptional regulator [Saccharothrix espanaensis DSM 44229]
MTAAGRPQRGGSSIGAVLAQLRSEFPDVTISKIRFLESEGLVRPARTASGYRQFTTADVERLRYVLAAQRDRYLPLKVIKEHLDAADAGTSGRVLRAVDGTPAAEQLAGGSPHRMTREDLLARSGLDGALLAELEQQGLVRPGPAGFYDQEAAQVATTVRAMTEFGLEPRHLQAFRAAADREVGLVEQIVAPLYRHRDPRARGRADEVVRELAALSVTLHTLLVKSGLRDVAGGRVSPR